MLNLSVHCNSQDVLAMVSLFALQACRALVVAGADLLRRNGKNRIPGSQLKVRSLAAGVSSPSLGSTAPDAQCCRSLRNLLFGECTCVVPQWGSAL
mgnify:CR=1 FL=1